MRTKNIATTKLFLVSLTAFCMLAFAYKGYATPGGGAWKKQTTRIIDLGEQEDTIKHHMKDASPDTTLVELWVNAFKAGRLTLYSNIDHSFTTKLKKEQLLEMLTSKPDTMTMIDPVNGKEVTKIIHHDPIPFRMNGEKIYNSDTVTAVPFAKDGLLEDRILKGIAAELDQLPDGAYSLNISNVVIGKHGEVAYYQNDGFYDANNFTSKNDLIPLKLRGAINTKIDELFHNAPYFQPGTVNQKNVPELSNVYLFYYLITVKDHKATVTKRH